MATVQDILEVACAAFRINGGMLRESVDGKIANGVLVKAHFYDNEFVEVTAEDRVQAEEVKNYLMQKVMIARLTSATVNEFTEKIIALLESPKNPLRNIGLLCWAPKLHADLTKADNIKQELNIIGISSSFLGKPGDKIETEFVAISKRFNTNFNCWRYTGHDNKGNLIGFLTKNPVADGRIKGRIKATEYSRYSSGKTTFLNYVKEVK